MAWPFTSVGPPNLDTGPGQAVPTGAAVAITAAEAWLLGAHFTNPITTGVPITVTMTTTAGEVICKVEIPSGAEVPHEWPFRPFTGGHAGVKWVADVAGLLGHVWGYV